MRLLTGVDAVAVYPSNWQPVFSKHTSNAFRDWNLILKYCMKNEI
jgi:hypothetical protein